MTKSFEQLKDEILKYSGTSRGQKAMLEYEALKLEEERKRNKWLYYMSFSLAIIAVVNLVVAIINLFQG